MSRRDIDRAHFTHHFSYPDPDVKANVHKFDDKTVVGVVALVNGTIHIQADNPDALRVIADAFNEAAHMVEAGLIGHTEKCLRMGWWLLHDVNEIPCDTEPTEG